MDNHTPETPLKKCTKCGQEFPATLEYFYKKERGLYGLYARCKACHLEQARPHAIAWNKSHPERMKETARRWNANPANDHRKRITRQSSFKRHQARINKRNVEYMRSHPEVARLSAERRNARKRSLPDTMNHAHWRRALGYFGGRCAVCKRQLNDLFGTHTAAMDHWIPLTASNCPGTVPLNIIPLCHGVDGCNNSKHSKNAEEWLIDRFGKRKAKQILQTIKAYFEWVEMKLLEGDSCLTGFSSG